MVDDDSIKKIYQIGVENKDENLIELLQKETQLSKQLLKSAIDKGALWLKRNTNTRRLRRLKTNLLQGDELFFYYQPKILQQSVEPAQLVDSSKSYGVWYKPSGMLCQGSRWSDHCTVTRDIEKQLNRNVYLVHRLDRAASGLIIIAYHKQSAAYFANLFQQKQIKKIYHAHVHGKWNDNNTLLTINEKIDNKLAISKIIFINYCEQKNESKLEVSIETGRKHQIRKHLSGLGFPIVGDRLYGSTCKTKDLQLEAVSLAFHCCDTQTDKKIELKKNRI